MPIQLPVLVFLIIFSQALQSPLWGAIQSAINDSHRGFDARRKFLRGFVPVQATYD